MNTEQVKDGNNADLTERIEKLNEKQFGDFLTLYSLSLLEDSLDAFDDER